jgi:hypothetical protein
MSASREIRQAIREEATELVRALNSRGHDVTARLGENAVRKGWAYYMILTCRNCGGDMHLGSSWTSCTSPVDLRRPQQCSGPGTHVLTEIEQARISELLEPAIADMTAAVQRVRYSTAPLN